MAKKSLMLVLGATAAVALASFFLFRNRMDKE